MNTMKKGKILKYIIADCVIGIAAFLVVSSIDVMNKRGTANQPQQNQISEETILTLKDYPELFSKDVIIVLGENASEVEKESAGMIKEHLKELTENEPIIKNDAELLELDKRTHNLILVGTPSTNYALQEVYKLTDATRVTNEYPGENKGILEILRNPWNSEKALLLVAGSDRWGAQIAEDSLLFCTRIELIKGSLMIVRNNTEMTEVIELTKRYMLSNNIKVSALETAKKISFVLEGPAKAILLKSFPILSQYVNSRVWEVRWWSEVEELEYVVIVDPETRDIVCGWGIDRLAAPGIILFNKETKNEN